MGKHGSRDGESRSSPSPSASSIAVTRPNASRTSLDVSLAKIQAALASYYRTVDEMNDARGRGARRISRSLLELDAARDYLETLWVQRELAELSRTMLYTGFPAIIVAGFGIFIAPEISGLTIARPIIVVLLGASIAVSLVSLSVLLAYVVRIALIAQRTAAFGPFIPDDEQRQISGRITTEPRNADE